MSTLVTLLTGDDDAHIDRQSLEVPLHRDCVSIFNTLKTEARHAGFDLRLASGYRSFHRQQMIWNDKVSGARRVNDKKGKAIQLDTLSDKEKVFTILHWSALPGASRHHLGTDVDIYDASALQGSEKLELTIQETSVGGVFEKMYLWLNDYLSHHDEFYRPFMIDKGGVAKEPWHLSATKIGRPLAKQIKPNYIYEKIQSTENFALKSTVLKHFDEIHTTFIAPYLR